MATTTNYGWTTPNDTDLVKDGAAAIRTLGSSIDTTVFNNASAGIPKTIVDAKGDIIAATGADTVARLAVGANNTILVADSTTATGLKWAAPAGGGKVLQVVNASQGTQVATSSSSFITTGLTATITPTSATSKILVLVSQSGVAKSTGSVNNRVTLQLHRNGVDILQFAGDTMTTSTSLEQSGSASTCFLDSPATTSATVYRTVFCSPANTATSYVQYFSSSFSTITLLEIGA